MSAFGAGGVADVTARLVADALGNKLGQRFVIENNPGAGGITAARAALEGGKDGYTLILLTNGTAISVPLFNHLPFDPLKDFVPISIIGYFSCVFMVNASSPFQTLTDFLKADREKPGAVNVGTINVGSTQNLTAELFKSTAGAHFVIVPFRASPDVVVGLPRNDVQLAMDFYAALEPTLDGGKGRAIATSGPQRSPELPNVPTVQDAGIAGFDVVAWNGLYAPAGTPQNVNDTLNKALQDVLADPALKNARSISASTRGLRRPANLITACAPTSPNGARSSPTRIFRSMTKPAWSGSRRKRNAKAATKVLFGTPTDFGQCLLLA